jgi:hypothetical protein
MMLGRGGGRVCARAFRCFIRLMKMRAFVQWKQSPVYEKQFYARRTRSERIDFRHRFLAG